MTLVADLEPVPASRDDLSTGAPHPHPAESINERERDEWLWQAENQGRAQVVSPAARKRRRLSTTFGESKVKPDRTTDPHHSGYLRLWTTSIERTSPLESNRDETNRPLGLRGVIRRQWRKSSVCGLRYNVPMSVEFRPYRRRPRGWRENEPSNSKRLADSDPAIPEGNDDRESQATPDGHPVLTAFTGVGNALGLQAT